MSELGQLISNYNNIRQRLRKPPPTAQNRGLPSYGYRIPSKPVVLEPTPPVPAKCRVTIEEIPVVPRVLKLVEIEKAVCRYFGIKVSGLNSHCRTKNKVYPRHICWYLAHEHTGLSLPRIGYTAGRDHTSVLHAYRKIAALMLVDEKTAGIIQELERELFRPIPLATDSVSRGTYDTTGMAGPKSESM